MTASARTRFSKSQSTRQFRWHFGHKQNHYESIVKWDSSHIAQSSGTALDPHWHFSFVWTLNVYRNSQTLSLAEANSNSWSTSQQLKLTPEKSWRRSFVQQLKQLSTWSTIWVVVGRKLISNLLAIFRLSFRESVCTRAVRKHENAEGRRISLPLADRHVRSRTTKKKNITSRRSGIVNLNT